MLEKRWRQHDQEIHKQRLRTVKSAVRDQFLHARPYTHNEAVRMQSKEAVQESKPKPTNLNVHTEKYAEIERENRILLEKMSNIMQDPKPKLYNPSTSTLTYVSLEFRAFRSGKSK